MGTPLTMVAVVAEHPPVQSRDAEVQQAQEEPSMSIEDLGLDRLGVPRELLDDMLGEEKLGASKGSKGPSSSGA